MQPWTACCPSRNWATAPCLSFTIWKPGTVALLHSGLTCASLGGGLPVPLQGQEAVAWVRATSQDWSFFLPASSRSCLLMAARGSLAPGKHPVLPVSHKVRSLGAGGGGPRSCSMRGSD